MAAKTCSTCAHWAPVDPSLDGGRKLLGTCRQFRDYESMSNETMRESYYQEGAYLENMRRKLKTEGAILQVNPPDRYFRAYLRTTPHHSCSQWSDAQKKLEPSLTQSRVS